MFYLLIFRVRLPPRLYSGNKKAGKRRSAPFTFEFTSFPPACRRSLSSAFALRRELRFIMSARSRLRPPGLQPGRNWRIGFDAGFNDRVQDAAEFFNGVCLKFFVIFYAGTIRPFGSRRKNKASDLWTSFRTESVLPWPMGSPLSCSIYGTTREKYRMRTSTGPRATRSSTSC